MSRSDLVDLTLHLHHETSLAYRVSDDGEDKGAVWLPKSQVEVEMLGPRGNEGIFTLPQWLAQDKGLI